MSGSRAKCYPWEGDDSDNYILKIRKPLTPKLPASMVLRDNYMPNEDKYHYPRPINEKGSAIRAVHDESWLVEQFGTLAPTPSELMLLFLKKVTKVPVEKPTLNDWIMMVHECSDTYLVQFMTTKLSYTLFQLANKLDTLFNFAFGNEDVETRYIMATVHAPDYVGNLFNIEEGLILQLMGDQLGISVFRSSESFLRDKMIAAMDLTEEELETYGLE